MPKRRNSDLVIDEVLESVREIKKMLIGNGEVGLCEKTRNNQTAIEGNEKAMDDHLKMHNTQPTSWKQTAMVVAMWVAIGVSLYATLVQ